VPATKSRFRFSWCFSMMPRICNRRGAYIFWISARQSSRSSLSWMSAIRRIASS